MKKAFKRIIPALFAVAAVYLIFLGTMMELRAHAELEKARLSIKHGDLDSGNRHYFQALNWYAPWGSSQRAADELMSLAKENMRHGFKQEAYQSLLRLRGGLLAARSFYVPRMDLIESANSLISLYLAEIRLGPGASHEAITARAQEYLQLYSVEKLPRQSWYFFAVLGFFLWVVAGFWVIYAIYGPTRANGLRMRLKMARIPMAIFVYGYALWIVGMSVA
ncbi:MAG: hypothetical protein LBP92_12950 [Deltaproteobacteria bacterium]|jgi:hypothetical protein|nr:hypothetical protein [Deltaproteobacteria bacterium]